MKTFIACSFLSRTLWLNRLAFLFCLIGLYFSAHAAGGTIFGTVTDARTQEPIVSASIVIENAQRGAVTDQHGRYSITGVSAGMHSVRASSVGYASLVRENVKVVDAESACVDFALDEQLIQLDDAVTVYAPVIDPGRTTPKTIFKGKELINLPLRTIESAISSSPSAYNGFIRGGRQYETKTIVEGIDVSDQFYAGATDQLSIPGYQGYNGITRQAQSSRSSMVSLNRFAIEDIDVFAGTTNSDLGSATAGMIAYSLQSFPKEWTAKANVSISQAHLGHFGPRIYHDDSVYVRERTELMNKLTPVDSAKARRYTYVPGKYSYGEKPTLDAEVAFGRSFDLRSGVLVTARYFNSYGRLPNEFSRRINSTLKFNYWLNNDMNFTAVGLLEDRGRILGWKNRDYADDFRFFLEGVPRWDGVNVVGSLKFSHTVSATTLYEIQASFVRDLTRRGFSDDNNDGVISLEEDGGFLTFADTAQVNRYMARNSGSEFNKFFTPTPRNESGSETSLGQQGGTNWKLARSGIFYERFVSSILTLKGDLTSQVTNNHLLKTGAQFRFHTFDRTLRAAYIGGFFPSYKNYVEEIWTIKPKEYGIYIEDRMEFEGLILNLGFRLDVLDLAAGDYANYFAPFRDDTTRTNGLITDLRRLPVRGNNASSKVFFSPRLGVSHPVSERAAMYFSFSRHQQTQPFSRLYANYNDFGNPSLPVVARANQDPIRSTNYDVGVQWMFAENHGLDLNAYYRDIENYSTIVFQVTPKTPWRLYGLSTNFGYADSRGVELTVRKNLTPVINWLAFGGRLSYAYSYIKQAVYTGGNVTSFSTASDSARYNGQLPFDDIRSFNTIERNVLGGNSTLTGGYDRAHRIAFNLLLRFPFEISLSSVGTFQSGFYYPLAFGDPRARELGVAPWNKRVDLRIEKAFTLDRGLRIALYVDVMNMFNWVNILAYNTSTLGQEAWEKYGDPTGGPKINRAVTVDGSMVYDIPREVYFGLNLTF